MPKQTLRPVFTPHDKASPAYRKMLETNNSQLKKSLKETQNQASTLQAKNNSLESDNRLLNLQLSEQGIAAVLKDLALMTGGASIPYAIDSKWNASVYLLIATFFLIVLKWIIDHFNKSQKTS